MMSISTSTECNRARAVGAVFGAFAVILGAFGAHALRDTLASTGHIETWHTAVLYHLVHSVAAFAIASGDSRKSRTAAWLWIVGIVLFSGSLYCLALGGPRWLGPVTPLGGVALILGWAWAAAGAWGRRGRADTH